MCATQDKDKPSYMGSKVARPLNVWTYDPIGRRLSACQPNGTMASWFRIISDLSATNGALEGRKKSGWNLNDEFNSECYSQLWSLIPVPSNFHSDPVNPVLSPHCWGQVKGYPLPRTASRYSVDSSCRGRLVFGRSFRSIFTSY